MQLISTLTCPECGHPSVETMPTNACLFFHDCAGCGTLLRPRPGDCCVFCSFGDVPCPPVQAARAGGSTAGCCDKGAEDGIARGGFGSANGDKA